MPRATQLSLEVSTKTGSLARLCRDLADHGVNLLALSAPETDRETGTVRLLVANRDLAQHALGRVGYVFTADEVLFVELKNRPGALAKAVEKLAKAGITIRSVYATAYGKAQKTAAVIAIGPNDLPNAERLLGRGKA
jgi:hypothetical protein